jgi:hypothetical protein
MTKHLYFDFKKFFNNVHLFFLFKLKSKSKYQYSILINYLINDKKLFF